MIYEEALRHCIFRYVSGSHAYGTQRLDGSSDEDIRGVFIAPLHCAFDLFGSSFIGSGTAGQLLKGGLLTNYQTVRKSLEKLFRLEGMAEDGTLANLKKKEILKIELEKVKLNRDLGGIRESPVYQCYREPQYKML